MSLQKKFQVKNSLNKQKQNNGPTKIDCCDGATKYNEEVKSSESSEVRVSVKCVKKKKEKDKL